MRKHRSTLIALILSAGIWAAIAPKLLIAQAKIIPSLPEAPLPHRRVLLLFPGYETVQDPNIPVATLRPRQKFEMAYRKTVDPSFLVESAMFAGYDQLAGYGPEYGSGAGPFAQRFGYNAANLASTYFFTDALLPVILHEDPRFFRKGSGSIASRVWWDLRSEAVGFNDQGKQVLNTPLLLGFGMSTALSNAYSPDSSITFNKTMERFAVKIGVSFGLNILREFGGLSEPEKHQHAKQTGTDVNAGVDAGANAGASAGVGAVANAGANAGVGAGASAIANTCVDAGADAGANVSANTGVGAGVD